MTEHCEYCGDELTCAQCEPNDYVESLNHALTKAQSLARERMLALESLTPGGSEFAGDVKMCVDFIKDERRRRNETIKQAMFRRKAAEQQVEQLKKRLEGLGGEFNQAIDSNNELCKDVISVAVGKVEKEMNDLKKKINSGGCTLAGPGRGDCEHAVGLPGESIPGQHDGDDDTVDVYGKPNGWCWSCWKDYRIRELEKELGQIQRSAGLNWRK